MGLKLFTIPSLTTIMPADVTLPPERTGISAVTGRIQFFARISLLTGRMLKVPTGLDPDKKVHLHIADVNPGVGPTPSATDISVSRPRGHT